MKKPLILAIILISLAFASCGQAEADQNATTNTNLIDARDSRPSQTIDKYLMHLDEAANLGDKQKTAITELLQKRNFEDLQRADQRKLKGELNTQITGEILSPEQTQAWLDYRSERRKRNQSRGK